MILFFLYYNFFPSSLPSPLVLFFLSCLLPFSSLSLNHNLFLPFSVQLAHNPVQDVTAQTWKCQLCPHPSTIGPEPALQVPFLSSICMYRVRSESSTWFNVHIKAKRSTLDRVYVNGRSIT